MATKMINPEASRLIKVHELLTSSSSLREVRVAIAEVMPAFRDWTSDCERRAACQLWLPQKTGRVLERQL